MIDRARQEWHQARQLVELWVTNRMIVSTLVPNWMRWKLFRKVGVRVERSRISPHVFVWEGASDLSIGANTFINSNVSLFAVGGIEIGRDVHIGPSVTMVTGTHLAGTAERRAGPVEHRPIRVGDGTWIGAGATVLPGVTIGTGCVIAAGAVVASDCLANGLYAGVPARRLRDL